jgi:hypothetical protein
VSILMTGFLFFLLHFRERMHMNDTQIELKFESELLSNP